MYHRLPTTLGRYIQTSRGVREDLLYIIVANVDWNEGVSKFPNRKEEKSRCEMISWKRVNLIFGMILCFGGFQVTYSILGPLFLENDLKDFIVVSLIIYAGGVLFHGILLFLHYMFSNNRLNVLKASLYALIGPFISLPMFVMALESSIGFTLFVVFFASLILQRINWKYVKCIIEDLKLSFYPHIKNGFNDFLNIREQRKHDLKN